MGKTPRHWAAGSAALLAALALTCCSDGSTALTKAQQAYVELTEPHPTLNKAAADLLATCISHAGFPNYAIGKFAPAFETLIGFPAKRSRSFAAREGYGQRIIRRRDRSSNGSVALYKASLGLADQQRFARTVDDTAGPRVTATMPDGGTASASLLGCTASVRKSLYGSVKNYLETVYLPQNAYRQLSHVDSAPSVVKVRNLYVTCMADAGFTVVNWQSAMNYVQRQYSQGNITGNRAGRAEIKIAVADARCVNDTALADTYRTAALHAAASWITQNVAALVLADHTLVEARRRAHDILQ